MSLLHRHHTEDETDYRGEHLAVADDRRADAHDHFGGINWGASFFGWLVAVGVTVLLAGIASAIATAVGNNLDLSRNDAEANASSIGLGVAIVLAVVMFIGYYAGGYVAGRMSRFDGARQGVGVWVVALVVMIIAAAAGAIFGDQYNVLDRIDLPSTGLSNSELGIGAVITGVVLLVVMLGAAMLGGATGQRYHRRVDAVVGYR
ncbi:hypothetical protein [Nocardioides sp. Kera G14]|uniref:hypothetical protein n=1 Tax=Nocardioides sp. Kera G14 TaxID=2884264 RepID=UPI001D11B730|nr:hypothetical protein [Nocardioides sp. Kera G14]UDY22470.1 hypothetical protein LH076_10295 [Nocardioides sp. Kera G14]